MSALALIVAVAVGEAHAGPIKTDVVQEVHKWLWPPNVVPLPAPAPLPKEGPPIVVVPIEDIPIPVSPVVVAPVRAEPARPKPKPKPKPRDDDDDERPAKRPAQNCKPITVDCNTVCGVARQFGVAALPALGRFWGYCEPTASQRAQGMACMRKQCPEVLKP